MAAAADAGGHDPVRQPRLTRAVTTLFAVVTGADYLQQAWVAVDKAA
jgi:hypothetical protein